MHAETPTKMVAQLEKELVEKFRGDVDSAIIPRLVNAIYPHVPDNLDSEFSLKTLEDFADRCGLDLSVKGIKSRNPPGDKSWKDPQRQLYDETVATILVLKVFHVRNTARFPNDESFLAEFPELEQAFAFTSDYTDSDIKRRKELDKIRTHKDLATERLLCNVMDIIATLYKNAKKVFKTQCIYLVADVAGDCRGHLGRDPSPSTLRLILYFERVTGITRRPARPMKPSVNEEEANMTSDASEPSSSSAGAGVSKKRKASSSPSRNKNKGLRVGAAVEAASKKTPSPSLSFHTVKNDVPSLSPTGRPLEPSLSDDDWSEGVSVEKITVMAAAVRASLSYAAGATSSSGQLPPPQQLQLSPPPHLKLPLPPHLQPPPPQQMCRVNNGHAGLHQPNLTIPGHSLT